MKHGKDIEAYSHQQELDDFWDISDLVVKPKAKGGTARLADTSVAHIEIGTAIPEILSPSQASFSADAAIPLNKIGEMEKKTSEKKEISELQATSQEYYAPQHPLIEEVRLYPWRNSFPYYERFCQMAQSLFDKHGENALHVPFFSYMPQYDQMSRAQREWYLYWRDLVRGGEYPDTDYSYIFLLVFEIINLPDKIPPVHGVKMLCDLWLKYRERHPILDRYLCEWVCDYCLIHRLPAPSAQLGTAISSMCANAQLREFYVPMGQTTTDAYTELYLRCCSNYDYRKSKVYQGSAEHAAQFDHHIPAALSFVLSSVSPAEHLFKTIKMQTGTVTRDAFVGALCSYRIKKKIEIRYYSFSRSHELRFFITDVVKYSENKLRCALGMKSRLSIYALPDPAKKALDDYFSSVFPRANSKGTAAAVRPEYEKFYDAPKTSFSPDAAIQIEKASWVTTQRLIEAFDEETEKKVNRPDVIANETSFSSAKSEQRLPAKNIAADGTEKPFSDEQIAFLRLVLDDDKSALRSFCRKIGKIPELLADAVNEIAADQFGDIFLEESDGSYIVIEEYRDRIASILEE